jgi:Raf kinase inhibitor-like YbhB/YbcL family protein
MERFFRTTIFSVLFLAICSLDILCADAGSAILGLSSHAFANGATIPPEFTCRGADKSPPLGWSGAPEGTKALALIVEDPDAPSGTFVHWVAFNLPADSTELAGGVPQTATLARGGEQGVNDFGRVGYNGPCPPPGGAHHYHFRLFALDSTVRLKPGATASALRRAMQGHVKAAADLVGIFSR